VSSCGRPRTPPASSSSSVNVVLVPHTKRATYAACVVVGRSGARTTHETSNIDVRALPRAAPCRPAPRHARPRRVGNLAKADHVGVTFRAVARRRFPADLPPAPPRGPRPAGGGGGCRWRVRYTTNNHSAPPHVGKAELAADCSAGGRARHVRTRRQRFSHQFQQWFQTSQWVVASVARVHNWDNSTTGIHSVGDMPTFYEARHWGFRTYTALIVGS
jgi:hypothetical protein